MASAIERHKRARRESVAAEKRSGSAWELLNCAARKFLRWRERRAYSCLVVLRPSNADEARQKLVYLMAALMTEPVAPDAKQISKAMRTLDPFKGPLAQFLGKRNTPLQ
ncbi:hypothetical protein [Chelatococcus asaccharovorans]|jgi:hypothetical protein|uniref:hypothetical protein n=1 Tax=Chelatococcus asaccharovorans TaxID=28210 RepID=UPI0011B7CAA3|nr:hypothetical protein [Chelatococcus asaccharovorans]MBS7708045.1 hypothetical protein [Chelatococcus asaccharovorans]